MNLPAQPPVQPAAGRPATPPPAPPLHGDVPIYRISVPLTFDARSPAAASCGSADDSVGGRSAVATRDLFPGRRRTGAASGAFGENPCGECFRREKARAVRKVLRAFSRSAQRSELHQRKLRRSQLMASRSLDPRETLDQRVPFDRSDLLVLPLAS